MISRVSDAGRVWVLIAQVIIHPLRSQVQCEITHPRGEVLMIRSQLKEFMRRMAPKSVAIIPGAHDTRRSNDTHYRFRQDSDFFYLTGFEEPDAIAVIKPEADTKYTLFVRPRDPEREIWDGRRAGVEGAKSEFGAQESFPVAEFDGKLREILDGAEVLYYRLGLDEHLDNTIIKEIVRMRGSNRKPIH